MKYKSKYLKIVCILPILLLIACSSAPAGWTRSAWSDFNHRNPDQAKALKYINSSAKRRDQLQIFLSEVAPETRLPDGHYTGVNFLHNSMTGENSYVISFPLQTLLIVMSSQVDEPNSPDFSDLLIQQLGVKRIEHEIQMNKAIQAAYANDPDAPKDQNAAESIHADELRLAHLREVAAKIKAIGG